MRRTNSWRAPITGVLVAGLALALTGAAAPKKKEVPLKVDETVGDLANIIGADFKVEGVGLVVGLDDTGSDPAPGWQRTKLINEMQKNNIEHPERFLRLKSVSMVTVRATVPAGVTTKDKFDVEVELPPSSATTSLAGGWLIMTQLAQRAATKEGDKDDKVIASAFGPIMIGNVAKPGEPKVGRVLGGGHAKEDSPYALAIKEARRSGKTSQLLGNTINQRFHENEGADHKGISNPKTDSFLVLKVPKVYHHNQDRYHKVIKYLSVVDNADLREKRLEDWGKELMDPKTVGIAAIKLEGMGNGSIPTLKKALESPDETVRFFAAEAMAYLNDSDSAAVLAEVARKKPEFRSYALKALSSMDQSSSLLQLRKLMNEPEYELRYGAFDALRTLDPTDPYLGKMKVIEEPVEPEKPDDMAMQLTGVMKKRPKAKVEDPFALYVIDCEGPPMMHVSRNLKCEIVLFGKAQKLLTPTVLGSGGSLLLNASDGSDQVQISSITSKTLDATAARVNSPLELYRVIVEMANLGASYPDIVSVLMLADKQKNLPGPLVIDALPAPSKKYDEVQVMAETSKRDASLKKTGADKEGRRSIRQRLDGLIGR